MRLWLLLCGICLISGQAVPMVHQQYTSCTSSSTQTCPSITEGWYLCAWSRDSCRGGFTFSCIYCLCYPGCGGNQYESGSCVQGTQWAYGTGGYYYSSDSHARPCNDCTACAAGQYPLVPCGSTTDASGCTACGPNTYSSRGASSCSTCSVCGSGSFMLSSCNSTQNTICQSCTVCTDDQFVVSNCTATSDTTCGSCPSCRPGQYRNQPCSSSSGCSECGAGEYQPLWNQSACLSCPANSAGTSAGQTDISLCLCNAGYQGDLIDGAASCSMCDPGAFKAEVGSNNQCSSCVEGE